MEPKPKKEQKSKPSRATADSLAVAFEKLAWNGGNVNRTATQLGMNLSTLQKWVVKHAEMYNEIAEQVRSDTIAEVVIARKEALSALRLAIRVHVGMLQDPKSAHKVRPSDLARAFDKLDKVMRLDAGDPTSIVGTLTIEERIKKIREDRKLDENGHATIRTSDQVH